jgi:hypothetical protein
MDYFNGKAWDHITREERFFCAELYFKLYSIDLGLSGKELANSLPDKQLQLEFSDNFKLSENSCFGCTLSANQKKLNLEKKNGKDTYSDWN